ncbi:isopenicillin N synthase family oxygenase [Frankia sp. CNm7]|uniref:Isopenicillin N synthase family oxygenase n=1 Tax=Frankia nepalensis TaxID=1836974 RepID=A0A937RC21_9ACTN|nr:2OG-Fe(II) oxygenase family protein [Frankia nepalensis]MBL7498056.1 isopenicillin N synthase family oxygenase [Frankia nepalensis]MBL7516045.1 isopenicillin N synthase family oxygenase [Frankia nepalensis]MBL7520090.1 isopenicillin N synthase family oxygenase [Frankia nepalensis]MBL7629358.1 isopenicillin N synthase family oxygenase [Frankia nepalensis]
MRVPSFSLPEVVADVRAGRAPAGGEFDRVCREVGAFVLTGLPLPAGLVDDVLARTREFFALPFAAKAARVSADDQYVGWRGTDGNRNEYGYADEKEMFHIGPRVAATLLGLGEHAASHPAEPAPRQGSGLLAAAVEGCGLWPAELPGFVDAWHRYYAAMQESAALLGTVMAAALGVAQARWSDMVAGNWADLAANYYPPPRPSAPPAIRNAVHSDLTLFTVLLQDPPGNGGLVMRDRSGGWHDVEPAAGEFVVNVGELLTYLTQGAWWAVPHEVRPADSTATGDRLTIPFFYRPSDHRELVPFHEHGAARGAGPAPAGTPLTDGFLADTVLADALRDARPLDVGAWVRRRKLQQRVTT